MVPVQHKSSIFMLLMAKDDNLLLQMGGLISSLLDKKFLTEELKAKVPELFYQVPEEELAGAESAAPMRGLIATKTDLLNQYFDVLTCDMPFRNFTLRLYARMLLLNDNKISTMTLT